MVCLATLLWQSSQFYVQSVYKATLPFTHTSKNLILAKFYIFLNFMQTDFLVQTLQGLETFSLDLFINENIFQNRKVGYFSKVEEIFITLLAVKIAQTVEFMFSNVAFRPTV